MKLSSIHKQDLLSLARVFNQPPSLVIRIGERYGYKVAYLYLDQFVVQNKPIKHRLILHICQNKLIYRIKTIYIYKLLTKINNHLKQLKKWKKQKSKMQALK